MRPTRVLATALTTALLLPACRSDADPIGPQLPQPAFSAHTLASGVTVRVDTIDRATGLGLGRGVSDAGGIPVLVISPTTGAPAGAVWTESGLTYLPDGGGAAAITAGGDVLGGTEAAITIHSASGSRVVGQGTPLSLNDLASVVVGFISQPVRWDEGVAADLQPPGEGVQGYFPLAVNNSGTVVGVGSITAFDVRAVRWDGTLPSFLPELAPGGAHGALGIDNAGMIVGYSSGTVDGVTGRFPVVWENGSPRPLTTLPGVAPFGNAQDIEDGGNIVGFLRTESGEDHAVLWSAAGRLIDLGASLPGLKSYARGVNAAGVVSGVAYPPEANIDLDTPILVRWTVTPATLYTFDGFYSPVATSPTVNVVKRGKAVPVRFSLGGDFGLEVFESGYPEARTVPCDPGAARHVVGEVVNVKSSTLTFDPATQRYTYFWKTDRSPVGTCTDLMFRFSDGQERLLRFQIAR